VINICDKIVITEMDDTDYLFDIIQHKYTLLLMVIVFYFIYVYSLYVLLTSFVLMSWLTYV